MKLLIFKLSPIGDTVMFLPVVQALRQTRPQIEVTVCTTPQCAPFYQRSLNSRSIWVEERNVLHRSWRRPATLLRWLIRVRSLRPDAVLLSFDQSSVARILAVASGAPIRIGGAASTVRWRGGLTHEIAIKPGATLAQWDWEMARVVAGDGWDQDPPAPDLGESRSRTLEPRRKVLIHPGASRAYQRWDVARFEQLAERLASNCDVTWILEPGSLMPAPKPHLNYVTTKNLSEFAAIAAASDLFVGNHSGPFHISSAVGTPCVIPTGPTLGVCDPLWGQGRNTIVRRTGLACMPCDKLVASPNQCLNRDTPMACLKYWSVEAVEKICRDFLARSNSGIST